MNPPCFVCKQTATMACRHPECTSPPFLCSGACENGGSKKLHTHNNTLDLIPISEFQASVEEIKIKTQPEALQRDYFNEIKKRTQIIKDDLKKIVDSIDEMVEIHENDLKKELKLNLTEDSKNVLNKLEEDMNSNTLVGKDIHFTMNNLNIFKKQRQILKAIESMKSHFNHHLLQLQQIKMNINLMSYREIVDKSKIFYENGMKLKQYLDKYQEALIEFQKAESLNDFDNQIYFQIARCLSHLNRYEQSEEKYKKCLELNPLNNTAMNNIGSIYAKTEQYQQAVEWFTKAIEINKTNSPDFSYRGYCYCKIKKLELAMADYITAHELEPSQESSNEIEMILKKMNKKMK